MRILAIHIATTSECHTGCNKHRQYKNELSLILIHRDSLLHPEKQIPYILQHLLYALAICKTESIVIESRHNARKEYLPIQPILHPSDINGIMQGVTVLGGSTEWSFTANNTQLLTKQDSASQHNILKEQYDYIYDPDNYLSADEYCFFDILIKSTAQTRRLALVSFPYGVYDEHLAILDKQYLVVLQCNYLIKIDLDNCCVVSCKEIDALGHLFELYRYGDSYIIYGELDIIRVEANFETSWVFSGSENFVTMDDQAPFEMSSDRIIPSDSQKQY